MTIFATGYQFFRYDVKYENEDELNLVINKIDELINDGFNLYYIHHDKAKQIIIEVSPNVMHRGRPGGSSGCYEAQSILDTFFRDNSNFKKEMQRSGSTDPTSWERNYSEPDPTPASFGSTPQSETPFWEKQYYYKARTERPHESKAEPQPIKKYSEELQSALDDLNKAANEGNLDKLNKLFRQLALILHPDKRQNVAKADDEFKIFSDTKDKLEAKLRLRRSNKP